MHLIFAIYQKRNLFYLPKKKFILFIKICHIYYFIIYYEYNIKYLL